MKIMWLSNYLRLLPYIGLVVGLCIITIVVAMFGVRYHNWRILRKRKMVFWELTPPLDATKTALANEELIAIEHGYKASRSLKDKLLFKPVAMSHEILGTYDGGIRFLIHVEAKLAPSVLRNITTYLPDCKINTATDPIPEDTTNAQVVEYKQTGHWGFALAPHNTLDQHDPMSFLLSAMSRLQPGERIIFQQVIKPVTVREAASIAHKVIHNEDVLAYLSRKKVRAGSWVGYVINKSLFGVMEAMNTILFSSSSKGSMTLAYQSSFHQQQVARRIKPARTISNFEQKIVEATHIKVSQPLFHANLRVMVIADDPRVTQERVASIRTALESYSVLGYQGLSHKPNLPLTHKYRKYLFQNRLPSLFMGNGCVLSTAEVAGLYHFPTSRNNRTDNVVTSLSRTLPAPLSLKQGNGFDVVIGKNYHHGEETEIGLTLQERARHMYVVGGTGNGKTTMMQYAIMQDILNGRGVAVIDPHGDLAVTILKHIPEDRMKDVVYFNPDDLDHPIGLNLLEQTPGLKGNLKLREKDQVTESVISIFRKIFSDEDVGGHRIEYVLRNTIHTAMTVKDATIFTCLKILQNANYRKTVTDALKDEGLKDFWKSELGQAGNMQRVKMSLGITSKVSRFRLSASTYFILQQPKSTVDFEDIINSGKILICNFAKGTLGEDTAQLFGIATLAKLQLAAFQRVRINEEDRQPFFLYVDEFQNFATTSFEQMLSEARKYRMYVTMAEQSLAQQDKDMVKVILANVGTVVAFKTGNEQDEKTLLAKFKPFLEDGDIGRLPAYNFYAELGAMQSQEPVSGKTKLLGDPGSKQVAERVIKLSQETYGGEPVEIVEEDLLDLDEHNLQPESKTTNTKVTAKKPTTKPTSNSTDKQQSKKATDTDGSTIRKYPKRNKRKNKKG